MHNQLPPASWVREKLGLPPLLPTVEKPEPTAYVKKSPDYNRTPKTRYLSARKVVKLVKSGMTSRQALLSVNFPTYYTAAIRECIAGDGPITQAVRAGDIRAIPARIGNGQASFVRWYYRLPKIRGQKSPDNDKLRDAFKTCGLNACQISREVGLHETTVGDFISGRQIGMFAKNRERCWEWVNTLNQTKS